MRAKVLVALLCVGGWPAEPRRSRDVKTTQGYTRGYFASQPPHYAFLGIPYAAVRSRFKAPEPPPRWDGIFEATHRIKCPQDTTAGDQNCLVVNVFTPEGAAALPVLVFVHDGHFQNGWGSHIPPSKLLSQGLIIVTFNYRLGPLGFICLKIPEAPGNAGLKDQIAALYWIQMNIERFGGNPSDVTVYGIGSGAAAVQILLLSGLVKGLLHKVILESGSVLSPTTLVYEPVALAFDVAVKLGYKYSDDPKKLAKFFRSIPIRRLTNVSQMFLPCVESSYYYVHNVLEDDPIEILKQDNFQKVPVIIVFTVNDGMSVVEKNKAVLEAVPEHFETLLPNNLRFVDEQKKLKIAELVKEFYFDSTDGSSIKSYGEYFHDVLFEYPIIKFGVLYSERNSHPVYIMDFMYKKVRIPEQNDMTTRKEKVINYIYGDELFDEDNVVADRLITLMSNFIKLGDPTPITTSVIPVIWKSVSEGSDEPPTVRTAFVLRFDSTLTMTSTHRNQRLSFWDHVYASFYRTHMQSEDV